MYQIEIQSNKMRVTRLTIFYTAIFKLWFWQYWSCFIHSRKKHQLVIHNYIVVSPSFLSQYSSWAGLHHFSLHSGVHALLTCVPQCCPCWKHRHMTSISHSSGHLASSFFIIPTSTSLCSEEPKFLSQSNHCWDILTKSEPCFIHITF